MFEKVPAEILRIALEEAEKAINNRETPAYRKIMEIKRIIRIVREYSDSGNET